MAYSNVGTPRFYINHIEWLESIGSGIYGFYTTYLDEPPWIMQEFLRIDTSIFSTIPKSPFSPYPYNNVQLWFTNLFTGDLDAPELIPYRMPDTQFIAILGHTLAGETFNVIAEGGSGQLNVENNGFTLFSTDGKVINVSSGVGTFSVGATIINNFFSLNILSSIGSVVIGSYYDMPHSPDLKLTMTREVDGVKRIRTRGGNDLINHKYYKPAMWGAAGVWELYSGSPTNQALSRSDRRVWGLSFSFFSDSSVFPDNQTEIADGGGWEVDDTTPDFMSEVLKKTNGGKLPFIFQPDKNDNNPGSGFAICKFKDNSLKVTQSAFNIYNISLSIEEVW